MPRINELENPRITDYLVYDFVLLFLEFIVHAELKNDFSFDHNENFMCIDF